MGPFTAAPHEEVLALLVRVAVLLLVARGLGEVAHRLRQPTVVGEILAGILLGPSLLAGLLPALGRWLVPQSAVEGYLLEVVSMIGAMFLLLITGLETDLRLIRHHARTAIGVSAGGIIVTFASGFALGQALPDDLLGEGSSRVVFALFLATALSISAIPVLAKVLMDLGMMRRDIGQTMIAAGMSDDTVGWTLLSIVVGVASGEAVGAASVLGAVGKVVAFMLLSFTLGRLLVRRALWLVQDRMISADRMLTLVVVLTFAWGALSQALQLEAVLGAFVMGMLFGQMPHLPAAVHEKLTSVALGIFAPIFFAVAGLKVDVRRLVQPRLLVIAIVVIAVATVGKVVGTYLGARLVGRRDHWSALAFGAGLNARGAMEIIIATIGLSLGILSADMFSIIVVMAMATSLMAPPALRWVIERVRPDQEETARLRQEELEEGSIVAAIHRVLVPLPGGAGDDAATRVETALLERLSRGRQLSVTLLQVGREEQEAPRAATLERVAVRLPGLDVRTKVVLTSQPSDAILEEAGKGYQLIVLRAPARRRREAIFHPVVDDTIRLAPCPTLVLKGAGANADWEPRRILVPSNGSEASGSAAELAFMLSSEDQEITLISVVEHRANLFRFEARDSMVRRQQEVAEQGLARLVELGAGRGLSVSTRVVVAPAPDAVIIELAQRENVDLIVLGTNVRLGSTRLFLGPRVERILEGSPCPVLVLNIPLPARAGEPAA